VRAGRVIACASLLVACAQVIHNEPINQPLVPGAPLATRLEFLEGASSPEAAVFRQVVSLCASDEPLIKAREIRVERR